MPRRVEPEILDSLAADDPRALRSRRDLRRLNRWMRNEKHLVEAIRKIRSRPTIIVEAGSGDGTFMLSLARRLREEWRQPVRIYLLDMEPIISEETLRGFGEIGWEATVVRGKIQDWLAGGEAPKVDLVLGNLFWHHLNDAELAAAFRKIAGITDSFIACEPRRWMPSLVATWFLWAIGCSRVTLHDGIASVRAGFRDSELSLLWPRDSGMRLEEYPAGWATHVFRVEN